MTGTKRRRLVGRDCPCPVAGRGGGRMKGRRRRPLAGRDCPCPVAGRSLRASCPSLTRMQTSLRNPCCARSAYAGSRGTGNPDLNTVVEVPEAGPWPGRGLAACGNRLHIRNVPCSESSRIWAGYKPALRRRSPLGVPPGTQRGASLAAACPRSAFHPQARSGRSPRRVPSGSPRLDANPRRQGHHSAAGRTPSAARKAAGRAEARQARRGHGWPAERRSWRPG